VAFRLGFEFLDCCSDVFLAWLIHALAYSTFKGISCNKKILLIFFDPSHIFFLGV
jgi:hypothetical protein